MKKIGGIEKFKYTKKYREEFIRLVKYFNKEKVQGLNQSKGILIMGNVGSGKTTMMKAFSDFTMMTKTPYKKQEQKKHSFHIVHCQDIFDIAIHDMRDVKNYYNPKEYHAICFDEIGREGIANIFGNKIDFIEQILCQRYTRGLMTHGTTNLSLEDIKKRYGARLESRIHEMFNIIELKSKDLRKL